tara:strand:- start:139 stop:321 length:183 start_codon:yes stop_codon:yes gene_type:complete
MGMRMYASLRYLKEQSTVGQVHPVVVPQWEALVTIVNLLYQDWRSTTNQHGDMVNDATAT